MKKVEEIKQKRQARFMFERFKQANRIEKERDRNIVRKNLAMIRSPAAGLKSSKKNRAAKVVIEEEDEHFESGEEDNQQIAGSEEEEQQLMETC